MKYEKVKGAVEVIEGQLSCLKEVLDSEGFTEFSRTEKLLIVQCMRMIVLAADESIKD